MAQEQEEAATRDFILRYFQKTLLNAEKVKTVRGKRSQFRSFRRRWSRTTTRCRRPMLHWCSSFMMKHLQR